MNIDHELDRIADEFIRSRGGIPTFKGYRGPYPYPASICTSPNDVVVHGIPDGYELKDGDVLSVDVGVTLDGYVADSAHTFPVGDIDPGAERLLEVCEAALSAHPRTYGPHCASTSSGRTPTISTAPVSTSSHRHFFWARGGEDPRIV